MNTTSHWLKSIDEKNVNDRAHGWDTSSLSLPLSTTITTKRQARSGTYGSRGLHFTEAQGNRDETSRVRPRTRHSIHCEVTGEKGTKWGVEQDFWNMQRLRFFVFILKLKSDLRFHVNDLKVVGHFFSLSKRNKCCFVIFLFLFLCLLLIKTYGVWSCIAWTSTFVAMIFFRRKSTRCGTQCGLWCIYVSPRFQELPGYEKQHWCRKCLSCGSPPPNAMDVWKHNFCCISAFVGSFCYYAKIFCYWTNHIF
jgi:hypothetical protein